MPKERKPTPPGDTDSNKQPQNFRFTTETIRKLEIAAREYGMSKTAYTELALKDRFKKDGIKWNRKAGKDEAQTDLGTWALIGPAKSVERWSARASKRLLEAPGILRLHCCGV
jgi:hypothetical protein